MSLLISGVSIKNSLLRVAESLGLDLAGVPQRLLDASVQKVAEILGIDLQASSLDLEMLVRRIVQQIDEECAVEDGSHGPMQRAWEYVKLHLLPSEKSSIINFSSAMTLLGGIALLLVVRYLKSHHEDIFDRLSRARGVLEAVGVLVTIFRPSRRRDDRQTADSTVPESVVIEMEEEKPPSYKQAVANTYKPALSVIAEETSSLLALDASSGPARPARSSTPPPSGFTPAATSSPSFGGARPKVRQPTTAEAASEEVRFNLLHPCFEFCVPNIIRSIILQDKS